MPLPCGMVFLLPSLPYDSLPLSIFVRPVVVLFPYTIVVATLAPNQDRKTEQKAPRRPLAGFLWA